MASAGVCGETMRRPGGVTGVTAWGEGFGAEWVGARRVTFGGRAGRCYTRVGAPQKVPRAFENRSPS